MGNLLKKIFDEIEEASHYDAVFMTISRKKFNELRHKYGAYDGVDE